MLFVLLGFPYRAASRCKTQTNRINVAHGAWVELSSIKKGADLNQL